MMDPTLSDILTLWPDAANEAERAERVGDVRERLEEMDRKRAEASADREAMDRAATVCEADPAEAERILRERFLVAAPAPAVSTDWQAPGRATPWLIEHWLPAGRVALLSGEGGRGKSKLVLMLAAAMARRDGAEWLAGGPELAPGAGGPVVFASWEDSRDDIRLRLCDWPAARPEPEETYRNTFPRLLGDRLAVMDCARAGPAWAPEATGSRHTSTMGTLTPTGAAIRAEAERREARLLVLDPLAGAFACNENDRGIVRAFMADWDGWARATGCTVLLIAHPPKSGADYSGSTDWHAAARAVWTLGLVDLPGDGGKATQLACLKTSYAARPDPLELDSWKWWEASPWPKEAGAAIDMDGLERRLLAAAKAGKGVTLKADEVRRLAQGRSNGGAGSTAAPALSGKV